MNGQAPYPAPYTRQQADQLALHLTRLTPRQWTAKTWGEYYQEEPDSFVSTHHAEDWVLTSPGDVTLYCDYDRGRYEIRAIPPKQYNYRDYPRSGPQKIGVTCKKSPRVMANDINRRMMGEYETYLDKLEQEWYKVHATHKTADAIRQALVSAGMTAYPNHGQTDGSGKLYVQGDNDMRVEYSCYQDRQTYRVSLTADNLETVINLLQVTQANQKKESQP